VVNFPNQEALLGATNNLFRKSADTGEPFQGALGRGGTSVMQHYLEMSNVDQTQELTDMIMAQNGFAANARSISVSQQLFDIVSSLIR
jgi:flagellar hook protein FlgE